MKNRQEFEYNNGLFGEQLILNGTFIANEEVEDILIAIEKCRVQKKIASDHEDKLKKELDSFVHEASEITDHTGYVLATWNPQKTSSFDRKRFDKDYPGVYESYVNHGETRKLIIKPRPIE